MNKATASWPGSSRHVGLAAAALAGALAMVPMSAARAAGTGGTLEVSGEASHGDITLREPRRYAVVAEAPRRVRRLYTTGDVLIDPRNPQQQVVIERIDADGVVVLAHPAARPARVSVGRPIPGAPGRTLAGIVALTHLRYRLKVVDRVVHTEPVLVSLTGSAAVLEREVQGTVKAHGQAKPAVARGAAKPRRSVPALEPELVTRMPVKQVDESTFVLDADSVEPVLDTVRRLVPAKASAVMAAFPQQGDVSIDMTSPLLDGTLSQRGFTVTNTKVAQAFGLEAGDTVLSLNGRAVNSPLNAWWAFQEMLIKQRNVSTLRVVIERGGTRVLNEYQIK